MKSQALEHSGHKLKSKGLMAMLSNGALFKKKPKSHRSRQTLQILRSRRTAGL